MEKRRTNLFYRILSCFIVVAFVFNVVLPPGYAQLLPQSVLNLPAPGTMVTPSAAFTPALINGITIHPENPLEFDFIVGAGDEHLQGKAFEKESARLIKYFLAALTVPEDEMWVNLSPYEKERIVPPGFGTTEMGRDLLAQDYILKQLTASLMYPEKELGKKFWDKIYRKAREQYGTTEIPVNTFNKVWIVPEKAVVYEHGNSAFVVKSHLRVMLEQDYVAAQHNPAETPASLFSPEGRKQQGLEISSQIIREIILPEIEREVNEGQGFTNLRQIYNSVILAAWFKQNLRQTLLGQVYVDKTKTKGVDTEDKTVNEKIYAQYLEAFKKGVYNYIKEDVDQATQEMIPRKYFSGGTNLKVSDLVETYKNGQPLTREQEEIVGEFLAGQAYYNGGIFNTNLVELSEEIPVAKAQEIIASSQRATKKSSSPVVVTPLAVGTLRDPASAADGIAWKKGNEYIFGGGFGYDLRINDAESDGQSIMKFMYALGRTLGGGKYLKNRGRALVTGDQRSTSDAFRLALAQGLADEGIGVATQNPGDVITTGLASRKGLADDFDLVIQITGSHNPKEGNGVKIPSYKGLPFYGQALVGLSTAMEGREGWSSQPRPEGIVVSDDFINEHIEALNEVLPDLRNPLSLVTDFRGGAAGRVFTELAHKKGYRVVRLDSPEADLPDDLFRTEGKPVLIVLNDAPSARMEAGIWDPSRPEAFDGIKRLQERIYSDGRFAGRRYAGVVFDGDGDRAGFMTEDSRPVMPERMLMAFYQRMILANEDGIRTLNELGHTVKLALDVRASKVIVDVLKSLALKKGLKIEGEFIAAGFPNHRTFVMEELGKIQDLLDSHPPLSAEKAAAVEKLMLEYTSAEASGHFFFRVLAPEKFLQKKSVVDDGITSSFLFLHLVETMNDYEFKDSAKKLSAEELTVGKADELFEVLPVTNEIRLSNAPSDVAKKQALAEEIIKVFARHHPDLVPMPLEQFFRKIEEARNNPPSRRSWDDALLLVDGIRVELTNGVWILLRKSNTSAVIVFKAEADSDEKKTDLENTMRFLGDAMREVTVSNPDFAGLKLEDYEKETERIAASSPLENVPEATKALANRDLKGVRVLIPADLNVPRTDKGEILDSSRLEELDDILKFLLGKHADVILLGHNGRLGEGKDSKESLRPLVEYFQLRFPQGHVTSYEKSITAEGLRLKPGQLVIHEHDKEGSIHILQDVRFADKLENGKPGSEERDAFGRSLAEFTQGGILIVGASRDMGSKGASVEDLPRHFEDMGGEVYAAPSSSPVLRDVELAVVGGKDFFIPYSENGEKPRHIVAVGDALRFILAAKGIYVGGLAPQEVGKFESLALDPNFLMPLDIMVRYPGGELKTVNLNGREIIPEGAEVIDIGPATLNLYKDFIPRQKGQIALIGPKEAFDGSAGEGTQKIVQALPRERTVVVDGKEGSTVSSPAAGTKDEGRGTKDVGGINLNPALLDLQIRRDANFVPLPLSQQPIGGMRIEGFIPVIINITPVTNLPMLLGLADTKRDTDETTPTMKAREPEQISTLN